MYKYVYFTHLFLNQFSNYFTFLKYELTLNKIKSAISHPAFQDISIGCQKNYIGRPLDLILFTQKCKYCILFTHSESVLLIRQIIKIHFV